MSVTKIIDSELSAQKRFHADLEDVPSKTADEMKEFFDHIPRRVLIPKVNELCDEVNAKANAADVCTKAEIEALTPADMIVEAGESDGWMYHKYSSGLCVCHGKFDYTVDICDSINMFLKSETLTQPLPSELFDTVFSVYTDVTSGYADDLFLTQIVSQDSTGVSFFITSFVDMEISLAINIGMTVVGRWR